MTDQEQIEEVIKAILRLRGDIFWEETDLEPPEGETWN